MGKLDKPLQKNKIRPLFTQLTKVNSKWIKYLNAKPATIKYLEEIIRIKFLDGSLGNNFLDMTPKAQATKSKINKLVNIQLKNFCIAKENINKMKRQPMEWEKYLQTIYLIWD